MIHIAHVSHFDAQNTTSIPNGQKEFRIAMAGPIFRKCFDVSLQIKFPIHKSEADLNKMRIAVLSLH